MFFEIFLIDCPPELPFIGQLGYIITYSAICQVIFLLFFNFFICRKYCC